MVHEAHHLAQEPPPFLVSTLGTLFAPTLSLLIDPGPGIPSLEKRNSTEARQTLLEQDLGLTNRSLRMNPKNYSVWEHRKWVLETMHRAADWAFEIKMVESFLEKDGRNCESPPPPP